MYKFFNKLLITFFVFIFIFSYTFATNESLDISEKTDILNSSIPSNSNLENIQINARHAVIFDRASRQILYGKSETEKCKMASTTKILTAILTIERVNLNDIVTVSSRTASAPKSRIGLCANDKISVNDLLYGLMLHSGNDAAVALAEYVGGSVENFSVIMNEKAKNLQMNNSHFVTPNGLDSDEHYSTALDMAILTDYALKNETFCKIIQTKSYTININGSPKTFSNTHELLGNLDGVYGGKTGFTNGANRCLITACKRGNLDIICVVLGCDTKKDRTQDSIELINYAFSNYSLVNIKDFIIKDFNDWNFLHKTSFTINKGCSQILDLYVDEKNLPYSYIAVNNQKINSIETDISISNYFSAPLNSNTSVGTLHLKIDGIEYFSLDIKNSNAILKKNIYDYIINIFSTYSNNFSLY